MPKLTRFTTILFFSAAILALPQVFPVGDLGYAYANNGNGNGNGNGGSERDDRGSRNDDRGASGNGFANRGNSGGEGNGRGISSRPQFASLEDGEQMHPSELGRWNAANANQAALDAHMRNGNFNGTIGALAQYQLAARASAGEELSDVEQAALDDLLASGEFGEVEPLNDDQIAQWLNNETSGDGVTYAVNDGVVSCSAGCDGLTEGEISDLLTSSQALADGYVTEQEALDEAEQLAALYDASEQRIIDGAHPNLPESRNETLLDQVAADIGVARQQFSSDLEQVASGIGAAGEQFSNDLDQAGQQLQQGFREVGAAFRGLFRN